MKCVIDANTSTCTAPYRNKRNERVSERMSTSELLEWGRRNERKSVPMSAYTRSQFIICSCSSTVCTRLCTYQRKKNTHTFLLSSANITRVYNKRSRGVFLSMLSLLLSVSAWNAHWSDVRHVRIAIEYEIQYWSSFFSQSFFFQIFFTWYCMQCSRHLSLSISFCFDFLADTLTRFIRLAIMRCPERWNAYSLDALSPHTDYKSEMQLTLILFLFSIWLGLFRLQFTSDRVARGQLELKFGLPINFSFFFGPRLFSISSRNLATDFEKITRQNASILLFLVGCVCTNAEHNICGDFENTLCQMSNYMMPKHFIKM